MIRMSSASLSEAVRTLHPGYFALVMATGIVSVGLRSHDMTTLSATLMWLAGGCYLVLLVVSAWRIAVCPTEVRRDLADPSRGFGFFTFVAGTNVLGARFALEGYISAAAVLLVVGGLAWLLLGYLVPWAAVLGHRHRPETVGANGTWFIWVVASQSVDVLAAVLEPAVRTGQTSCRGLPCWATVTGQRRSEQTAHGSSGSWPASRSPSSLRCSNRRSALGSASSRWWPSAHGPSAWFATVSSASLWSPACCSTSCGQGTSPRPTGWRWGPPRSPPWPGLGSYR